MASDDTDSWRLADAAFERILDLPPAEQAAAVAALPPPVRALVQRLLTAGARRGILERPRAPLLPARVGPWRIGVELGRGGMSVVLRAERELGDVCQSAALKLLTVGALAAGGRERFLRERAALARLQHPHIARLLDAGVLDDGTPWLAMELVEGERIDIWCERQGLDARAICRLAAELCAAVDYAHRQLVVHRDIKPGNVLVDRHGHLRLLDFGIARLLQEDDAADITATGACAFTPDYAAPEQRAGAAITTACDVYGLGALLYRLLSGRPPPRGADGALERTAWLSRLAPAQLPPACRRQLDGDLDLVLARALAADPQQRYPSAAALGEDLVRWLKALPVRARAPTLAYRTRMFLTRHRLGALAALAVLALLLAALGGIVRERNAALAQAQRAQSVRDFLAQVFTATEPSRGRVPDALEILDAGSQRARQDLLPRDPQAAADVLIVTGMARRAMSDTEGAREDLQLALRTLSGLAAPPARELSRVHWELASLFKVTGPLDASLRHARAAVAQMGDWAAPAADVLGARNTLASVLSLSGDAPAAERETRAVLAELTAAGLDGTALQLDTLNTLSTAMAMARRPYADTLPVHLQRIDLVRRLYGANSGWYAYTLADAVPSFRNAGQLERAEALARESVAVAERVYHKPDALAAVPYCNLAALLMQVGRLDESLPWYDRTIANDEAIARNNLHAESCRAGRAYVRAARGDRAGALADLEADRHMLGMLGRLRSPQWLSTCALEATLRLRGGAAAADLLVALEGCEAEHGPAAAPAPADLVVARAELDLARGQLHAARRTLEPLLAASGPDPTRRRWLRPWLLALLVAQRAGDAAWRDELAAILRPALSQLAQPWDASARAAACVQAPTPADCLVLP